MSHTPKAATFAAAAMAAIALAAGPVQGADFAGKTISFYIGYSPGGGYDLYGRLTARHMGAFIPGNPNIVAKNMPGAGGLKMTNWLYNVAPKDGTAIGSAPQQLAIEQVLGSPGIKYDVRKFVWIGRLTPIVEISYTWHTSKTKTLADARKYVTPMGGTGPTSPTITHLKELNTFAGTKFKPIPGFKGSTGANLAMERGEVDGATKSWPSLKVSNHEWLEKKMVNLLVQYARVRAPDLPDVPAMTELGRTKEDRKALEFLAVGNEMGRTVFAPPGLSKDATAMFRDAFDKMVKSKAFKDDTSKHHIETGPMGGVALTKVVESTFEVSPAIVARVNETRK